MKKAMDNFDLIIKNGEVFDGTGAASKKVDIAVKDGVIAKISESILDSADKTIDASGKVVTPGFVDVHTHYDGQATWDDHLNPSSNLGTTTVVAGNCGSVCSVQARRSRDFDRANGRSRGNSWVGNE